VKYLKVSSSCPRTPADARILREDVFDILCAVRVETLRTLRRKRCLSSCGVDSWRVTSWPLRLSMLKPNQPDGAARLPSRLLIGLPDLTLGKVLRLGFGNVEAVLFLVSGDFARRLAR
jgi:hypothetical protein